MNQGNNIWRRRLRHLFIIAGASSFMGIITVPSSAAPLPPAGIAETPEATFTETKIDVPEIKLNPFDAQRVELEATHIDDANQLTQNLSVLDGKVVEMEGKVVGVMKWKSQDTVLVETTSSSISLRVPAALKNSALLTPETQVRILADVRAASTGAARLTLLNIDKRANNNEAENIKVPDTSSVVLAPTDGSIAALPAPPDDTVRGAGFVASAQMTPTDNSVGRAQTIRDVESIILAQKPVYAQMIAGSNGKLKQAQVDEIAEAILRAGFQYKMDPRFLASVIGVESSYNIFSLSRSGAMGLGQIMPFNLKTLGIQDPWNPTQNIFGTAKMLRNLLDMFKDKPNSTLLAVAAYNAGAGAVRRAGYNVPNGAQVRRYVWKVYYRYKALAPDMF